MKKICNFFLCVTLLIAVVNIAIIDSALTVKQMLIAASVMRETCQPQFKLTDELIDGLKVGQFPDNDELKCYVNCNMELMTLLQNGVVNFDLAIQQAKAMLPDDLREPYTKGLVACRNAVEGVTGNCQIAYTLLECIYRNNPKFLFP